MLVFDVLCASAECIMFPEVPMSLRMSGHLLLGLVRIYSRKVNYVYQDCNRMQTDARMAVASTQVNFPADADHAPFDSVTLPETFELDKLDESHYRIEYAILHSACVYTSTLS